MASTFTPQKDLEQPGIGEQKGVWGKTINRDLGKIDANLARVLNQSILVNVFLTTSQAATATSDAAVINLTGNIGATSVERTVTFPSGRTGVYIVDTTEVTFGTSNIKLVSALTDNGVTLTSAGNRTVFVYTNGTSVRLVDERSAANVPLVGEIKAFAPPGGTIVSANLPFGWYVANGNNGTNDLRGKFLYGTSVVSQTGDTGGAATDTINVTNNGVVTSTTLTEAQIPSHTHGLFQGTELGPAGTILGSGDVPAAAAGGSSGTAQNYAMAPSPGGGVVGRAVSAGGGQAHTHTYTPTSTNQTVDTLPPYFRLVYLQYTGV